jgi:AraC family transcriptional regulator, regulatory protein of adaptative response / DNA-3-methyladenine glycosylase II
MDVSPARPLTLDPAMCARALDARDARFDGLFFVGITTTRVYCRPVCPARVSYPDHRRFFNTAAAAERAGYRPCLRCRPELAPGCALVDAVPRLAHAAAERIAAGALNGRHVAELARDLGVTERHLRRVLEHEIGVSPVELALTHRLLLAKRLLTDTDLPVTRVAFASGFQSLRRFNDAFREHYRMAPGALRRARRAEDPPRAARGAGRAGGAGGGDLLRLTLAYRAPLDWDTLLAALQRDALPGVETVEGRRYGRTIRLDGHSGLVFAETAAGGGSHVNVDVSPTLLPVLMPLLARLRRLLDLDAEPTVIDGCLDQAGLGALVRQRPGVRIPGAVDGFEVVFGVLLHAAEAGLARRVVEALGDAMDGGTPALTRLAPGAAQVAAAGARRLLELGVPRRTAEVILAVAGGVMDRSLRLEPGADVAATHQALLEIDGIDDACATAIVLRALDWPDAFSASDPDLLRAAGAAGPDDLTARAEQWRPWRAYAACHLRLQASAARPGRVERATAARAHAPEPSYGRATSPTLR